MSRRWIAVAFVAAAAAAALLIWRSRPPRVRAVRAARTTLVPVIAADGEMRPPERTPVFPGVIGRVLRMEVSEGARVSAGDVIAELDGSPYADQAAAAEGDVTRAQAAAARADAKADAAAKKLDRARRVARQKIASADFIAAAARDLDAAREEAAAASAALDTARARWRTARAALARVRVVAPSAGVVAALRARVGDTVSEGAPVAVLENRDAALAAVRVPSGSAGLIADGEKAEVRIEPLGRSFRGAVRPSAANNSDDSTYQTVMIEIPSPVPDARPGMRVSARIEGAAIPDALTVPARALVVRAVSGRAQTGVFVVDGGGVRFRPVRTGAAGNAVVQVLSGLAEGETVAAGPASAVSRLRDGGRAAIEGE